MGFHRIAGSEVFQKRDLLPGYGSLRIGPGRRGRWTWLHSLSAVGLVTATLIIAGTQGLLP